MDKHPIIKVLEAYEDKRASSANPPAFFAFRMPWLARRLWLQGQVPGYAHADFFRSVLARIAGRGFVIRSAAQSIQLKEDMTRMRAFYLPEEGAGTGHCLKIVCADGEIGVRMRDELALRKTLEALGTVNAPAVFESGEAEGFIYLAEEMIVGRRFSLNRDADAYIAQGLPQMIATYKKYGIEQAPLAAHFDASMQARLSAIDGIDKDFLKAVGDVFVRNARIPVSLCHGDLLPSNMCRGADKFYLLDWDRSFNGAIVRDLLRLPMKSPDKKASGRIAESVLAVLRDDLGAGVQSTQDQLTVYVAQRMVEAPKKWRVYRRFWRRHSLKGL